MRHDGGPSQTFHLRVDGTAPALKIYKGAVATLPNSEFWLQEGMSQITTQASNFGPKGVKDLAIL